VALAVDSLGPHGLADRCGVGILDQAFDAYASARFLPEASPAPPEKSNAFRERDRWFESVFLQQRVGCELDDTITAWRIVERRGPPRGATMSRSFGTKSGSRVCRGCL
jgi:hypothetical protein